MCDTGNNPLYCKKKKKREKKDSSSAGFFSVDSDFDVCKHSHCILDQLFPFEMKRAMCGLHMSTAAKGIMSKLTFIPKLQHICDPHTQRRRDGKRSCYKCHYLSPELVRLVDSSSPRLVLVGLHRSPVTPLMEQTSHLRKTSKLDFLPFKPAVRPRGGWRWIRCRNRFCLSSFFFSSFGRWCQGKCCVLWLLARQTYSRGTKHRISLSKNVFLLLLMFFPLSKSFFEM